MARFTFATGNAKKVLALPLYGLGTLASPVVPRRNNLWVFGSGIGIGEGALALLLYAREADSGRELVWLTRNDRDATDAKALGIATASARSARGFWLTLRARVVVVTHGFGDANRFGIHGALVVQLWHGIPFKHLHLDSAETTRLPLLSRFALARRAVRQAYVRAARGIGMFTTASPISAARIRSAFGLPPERVVVTGDPRDDVLVMGTASGRSGTAKKRIAELLDDDTMLDARLLLYAPTWRDGELDPAIPTEADWQRIVGYLEKAGSVLIVRSHPLGAGDYSVGAALSNRVRMLGANLQGDVTPLLPAFDVLITDYSSIAFDYSLVGNPIVFLAPDFVEYSARRGAYEPFVDFSGGDEVASWDAAVGLLESIDGDPVTRDRFISHAEWLATRMFTFRDGRNTERVYDEILARLDGTVGVPDPESTGLPVSSISLTDGPLPELIVSGEVDGRAPSAAGLTGGRLRLNGSMTTTQSTWTARIPLLSTSLGGPQLPPPSGRYRLRMTDAQHRVIDLNVRGTAIDETLRNGTLRDGLFRVAIDTGSDGIILDFSAPLTAQELGAANQARLAAAYRASTAIVPDTIFFESYYAHNVSSNPRGIDRAIAALRPDTVRYWSVVDASVEVSSGAIAVIEGSDAWWQARASAQLLIVNDWLRKRHSRRPGQTVLQTWHGTPLKRLALDRPGIRPRTAAATRREKSHWDIMLAQNPFSAKTFRSAYAFRGPIWQEGYPRNDILLTGDGADIRERLGIAPDVTVVMYAPTWRDDRPGTVDILDVASFAKNLGPGFITLLRGHSRTLDPGSDVLAPGVIDVTTYPDIADLFLVADALITDYSSVMFDFSVTGKPLYFFTPDLKRYRDELRGFYFDLLADAPGPVLTDQAELIRQILAPTAEEFADRYAAWQARFNPRDDGHAGERVVQRLVAEGLLGSGTGT